MLATIEYLNSITVSSFLCIKILPPFKKVYFTHLFEALDEILFFLLNRYQEDNKHLSGTLMLRNTITFFFSSR